MKKNSETHPVDHWSNTFTKRIKMLRHNKFCSFTNQCRKPPWYY